MWRPAIRVRGSSDVLASIPSNSFVAGVRNDTMMSLSFPYSNYAGEFSLEFDFTNIFPQEYLFVWAGKNRPAGVFEIYANGELIREFDLFNLRKSVASVIPGGRYFPDNGYNKFDALIDNLTEFGNVTITIKYKEKSTERNSGLTIDYIALIPTDVVVF